MPKVFIIILNWNGCQDTLDCIESLTKIDYPDYKIVVVDNGSRDGSGGIIPNRYRQDKNFTFIETKKNLGFAGGNNVGILHVMNPPAGGRADYVLLLFCLCFYTPSYATPVGAS